MTYPSSIRRILIVRTDRMGDLILSLPAVHAIRQGLPQTEISLLVQSEIKPLLEGHPDVDRLLSTNSGEDKGWREILRTAAWIRRCSFDAILVLNPTRRFHVASFLAQIPMRIGYRRKWGGLLTRSIPDRKSGRDLREPCLGRTFLWTADSPQNIVTEQYREEQSRSTIYRVRHSVDEAFVFTGAGYLLSNITA